MDAIAARRRVGRYRPRVDALGQWLPLGLVAAGQHAEARLDLALAQLGLTHRHLCAMLIVEAIELGSQNGLSERIGVDRTTGAVLVSELVRRNLAERRPNPRDRRRREVRLTQPGDDLLTEAKRVTRDVERALLAPLRMPHVMHLRKALPLLGPPERPLFDALMW